MLLAKLKTSDGLERIGVVEDAGLRLLQTGTQAGCRIPDAPSIRDAQLRLCDILHADDPLGLVRSLMGTDAAGVRSDAGSVGHGHAGPLPLDSVTLLAPIDEQEVWAAGVTYKRSQAARMQESETGASHYDRVYTADRPELFFKATPGRVASPGRPVRVRGDSAWSVPEPEFTLVITPAGRIAGYTIGNDMSARDIEGENPLYLPQAKLYRQCCALGPYILVPEEPLDRPATKIVLTIERGGGEAFRGETDLGQMARTFEDLAGWLCRENELPQGAFLLTGTGIVPPDEFTLQHGDVVHIEVSGIGRLTNPVVNEMRES